MKQGAQNSQETLRSTVAQELIVARHGLLAGNHQWQVNLVVVCYSIDGLLGHDIWKLAF